MYKENDYFLWIYFKDVLINGKVYICMLEVKIVKWYISFYNYLWGLVRWFYGKDVGC